MSTIFKSGRRTATREQMFLRGGQAAAGFESLGEQPGTAVAMLLRNDFVFFECLAASRLGRVCLVPLNWHFHGEEIQYLLEDSDAKVLVIHADLLPAVAGWVPNGIELLLVETPPEIAALDNGKIYKRKLRAPFWESEHRRI